MKSQMILIIVITILFINCTSDNDMKYLSKNIYCFDDGYNEMHLFFKEERDTVFFYYYNIVDSGNYINGYADDSTDYAGFFTIDKIEDSTITFKIKNYRFATFDPINSSNLLRLKFRKDETVEWEIDKSEKIGYLPYNAHFIKCNK